MDKLIIEFDKIVRNLFTKPISIRKHPDAQIDDVKLSDAEKKHVIGLMRVNYCGEVCAQALYQGHALTSRDQKHKEIFEEAANEETEHLAWTRHRIEELGGKVSFFNPLFYAGSLAIAITAGIFGDKWNLGFLEETEHQVEKHLANHLDKLPKSDFKSHAILSQMREDEIEHANKAHNQGAANLPTPIKMLMALSSKCMTKLTYYI